MRRQSSREGLASNGGGCSATHLLGLHHRNNHHHYNQQQPPHHHLHHIGGAISAPGISYFAPQRRWKNSRRSRNGGGSGHNGSGGDSRGLPKKGGAGGKGVWGLLGSELLVEEDICDAQDPNYDSEANDAANTELLEVIAVPTPEEFYKLAEPVLLEYYENGDTVEAMRSLHEVMQAHGALGVPYLVVNAAVEMSMNHKDSHREMASLLISDMYGKMLRTADIEQGFGMLLDNLDDLVLDTPEAPTWLGNFMARAVADDCIPPRFVFAAAKREGGGGGEPPMEADLNGSVSSNGSASGNGVHKLARIALKRADSLLSLKTTMVHLDNIWGSAGPLRPVKNITKRMTLLLREFIDSRDVAEAQRCLRALEVPHYHHELVYEAVVMALEAVGGQQAEEAMCAVLRAMDEACLVSPAMMEQVRDCFEWVYVLLLLGNYLRKVFTILHSGFTAQLRLV